MGNSISRSTDRFSHPMAYQESQPLITLKGSRTARRFIAVTLSMASIGLWLAPGANWSGDVLALKAGLTLIFSIVAVSCILPRA